MKNRILFAVRKLVRVMHVHCSIKLECLDAAQYSLFTAGECFFLENVCVTSRLNILVVIDIGIALDTTNRGHYAVLFCITLPHKITFLRAHMLQRCMAWCTVSTTCPTKGV